MIKRHWFAIIIMCCTVGICVLLWNIFGKREYINLRWNEGTEEIANPDRGFYFQIDTSLSDRFFSYFDDQGGNLRVALLAFDLSDYPNETQIPDQKMEELSLALKRAEELGIGVVLRAAYDFSGAYEDPEDFKTVLSHVEQIAEAIEPFQETIMGVQAGLIGPFGEWHSSRYAEEKKDGASYRVLLLQKMLDVFPSWTVINVRRPAFIREAEKAGLDVSRIGCHNDALLSTDSDMGTYVEEGYDRETELKWVNENVQTWVNGGEMPNISEYTEPSNAVHEFDLLNISYLNRFYNEEVIKDWKKQEYEGQNAYEYIKNHLGYRLSLSSLTASASVNRLQAIELSGRIENSGFSKVPEEYVLKTVIEGEGLTYKSQAALEREGEKKIFFEAKIAVPRELFLEKKPFRLGFELSRGEKKKIEFADKGTTYEDGINFYVEYHYNKNTKRYELTE